jgi:transposase
MFAQDADARQIARSLRVSTKSAYQWRRAWRSGGRRALASKGPGGNGCKLDEDQLTGSVGRWMPVRPLPAGTRTSSDIARVEALITRLFGVWYTLRGVSYLLHRLGFTPQVAAHRAAEREEDAIPAWRSRTWAKVRG